MFTEGKIGNLKVKNRFIRSATAEFGANADGTITDCGFDTSLTAATLKADAAVISALGANAKCTKQEHLIVKLSS